VCVTTTGAGGEVRVDVADTGVGIDPEDLERVFEDFTQAKTGRSKSAQGTGLGLPISRRLAELMGGRILVASKVGQGTTFTVFLPAADVSEVGSPPHLAPRPGTRRVSRLAQSSQGGRPRGG